MKKYIFATRLAIQILFVMATFSTAQAYSPEIENALTYLYASQNPDDTWGADDSVNNYYFSSAEVAITLDTIGATSNANFTGVLAWLNARDVNSTAELALRILATSYAGADYVLMLSYMDQFLNAWGGCIDYENNNLDTAMALLAINKIGDNDPGIAAIVEGALYYLEEQQNSDGGWGFTSDDDSDLYVTAQVVGAIALNRMSAVQVSIDSGVQFLLGKQNGDGGFGTAGGSTAYETALAFMALQHSGAGNAALASQVQAYLLGSQLSDGSWNSDAYETALAIRALTMVQPNLSVTAGDITFDPAMPISAEAVTLSAVIHNNGFDAAQNVVVRFFQGDPAAGGTQIGSDAVIANLAAGASATVQAANTWTDQGEYPIYVAVDPDNNVVEMNENDNVASQMLYVVEPAPDLTIGSGDILFNPAAPLQAESFTIRATVHNTGRLDAGNVAVRFYAGDPDNGGVPIGADQTIGSIAAGAAGQAETTHFVLPHGPLPIYVRLDPADAIAESREDNNQAFKIVTIMPLPDLSIAAGEITFNPADPAQGQTVKITAAVRNTGGSNAPAFVVLMFDGNPDAGGTLLYEYSLNSLAAGGAINLDLTWSQPPPGAHDVYVRVDAGNAVAEVDEGNNQAFAAVTVQPRPDVNIYETTIASAPAFPGPGQTFTLYAQVYNQGGADAANVVVRFFQGNPASGGVQIGGDQVIASLAAGDSQMVQVTHVQGASGDYAYYVVVDPENGIAEISETNNQAVHTVSVKPVADLSITPDAIVMDPVSPRRGQSFTITAQVENVGEVDAADVVVRFFDGDPASGGTQIGTDQVIPAIAAGGGGSAQIAWTESVSGDHLYFVQVDPGHAIDEANRANNLASKTVTVQAVPDLTIAADTISVAPAFPKPNAPFTITAQVLNQGDGDAADVAVRLYKGDPAAGGVQIGDDQVIAAITAGAGVEMTFTCTESESGEWAYYLVADPGNAVAEADEQNNSAYRSVRVFQYNPFHWADSFVIAVDDYGRVSYAKSHGDGTFGNYAEIADLGGGGSRGVIIEDFDGDGDLDFIAGRSISSTACYFLFLNDGTDTFGKAGIVGTLANASSYATDMGAGDFNNDGAMDFIANTYGSTVGLFLGDGRGGFSKIEMALGNIGLGMDTADFNRDGNLDFARSTYSDGNTYAYLGNGDGTFQDPLLVGDTGNAPYGLTAADFDDDGLVDLMINSGSGGDPYFFKGNGDGSFAGQVYVAALDVNNYSAYDAYDLNADGHADILAVDYTGHKIWFYPGMGDGTFGTPVQVNTANTYSSVIGCSAPPYRVFGQPYALVHPAEQDIALGAAATLDGSSSNDGSDGGSIVDFAWDLGDGQGAAVPVVEHTYATEGIYAARLTVTDDSGLRDKALGVVRVQGAPPVADPGGPYAFGESTADNGIYTVTLDGGGSSDDFGIADYRWTVDLLNETFDGTALDDSVWLANAQVSQNDSATITGTNSWGGAYLFSQADFYREPGMTLYARILPVNPDGNQYGMVGFKNTSANYSYNQMPYAVYFRNGEIAIYEYSYNRGTFGSYTRGVAYEVKIVLLADGADFFVRPAGTELWQFLYRSSAADQQNLKAGITVSTGTFEVDDIRLTHSGEGQNPELHVTEGLYPVTLTVTDSAGQQASAATTLEVAPNNPPVADPGGPYAAGEADAVGSQWMLRLDGSGSSDDFGILHYSWDFDASDGIQEQSIEISPIHFYTAPGVYAVTLTVTDHGLQSHAAQTTVTIDVNATQPPAADPGGPYAVNEEAAQGGLWTVFFDGGGSTDNEGIATYEWNFGDGGILTTWYAKERHHFFEAGTKLYGYDVPEARLYVIATQNNTKVRVVNLETGQQTGAATLSKYQSASNLAPGDGIYFKLEADKPVVAYLTDTQAHSTFIPSLDAGSVGHEFIFQYYNTGGSFLVFATETSMVRFFNTSGTVVAERLMNAGTYWDPGLNNGYVYHVRATGRIAMQTLGASGFTTVPAAGGDGVGRLFYCATHGSGGGALAVFAYENATVTVRDLDTGEVIYSPAIDAGGYWWQTGMGLRHLRIESSGDVGVWAGDAEGGNGINNLGDDISFAGGRDDREFYLHGLAGGAVIFAPYDDTLVNIDGLQQTLNADGLLPVAGSALHHITASRPVVIQTLGSANGLNDMGTYLGGIAQVYHQYSGVDDYTVTLKVTDHGSQSNSQTTLASVGHSNPPVVNSGGPYMADESNAKNGQWLVQFDAGGSTDDFGIFKFEWDFDASDGISVDATGAAPSHYYNAPGTYTVTLRVYDHALQLTEVTTQVTVQVNDPPVADAGGPYIMGEETARDGKYVVTLNGAGSSDDNGIATYIWDFGDRFEESFGGTVIDDTLWIASEGVVQDGMVTITGNGQWGQRYCFSREDFKREGGSVFSGRISHQTGNALWGLKNASENYNVNQMPYAIYLSSGRFYVYEDGSFRSQISGNYNYNSWYDVKIELKPVQGARYYIKADGQSDWTLLYDSDHATMATLFKLGAVTSNSTLSMDDLQVVRKGFGISPTHTYEGPGTYDIHLTVTDHGNQTDGDATTLVLNAGTAPVADAGGPYSGEPLSFIRFNGAASHDDTGIARYVWDFGDGYTAQGAGAAHFYKTEGTYTAILTVYDNLNQSDTAEATVTVGTGSPPIAEAGGPYTGGVNGPPVYFDGTGSSDDSGILSYTWDITYLNETFDHTQIDGDVWAYGSSYSGAISLDSNELVLQGYTGVYWGSSYIAARESVDRSEGTAFAGRVRTDGGPGYFMFGWKDYTNTYSYQSLVHAIFFNDAHQVIIYEDGYNRGTVATYQDDTWYDVRIELKSPGARYYLNDALIYESEYSSESNLRPCITTARYLQRADDLKIETRLYGARPFFTYRSAGASTAVLTVTDGAGQVATDTAVVEIQSNLPPKVICVPWVATDVKFPHETWNGKQITLKGIVKDADAARYQWDFGDGTTSAVMDVTDPYDLSVTHTYPDMPDNTPFVATLTVWDAAGQSSSDAYNVAVKEKTIDVEINVGIDEALWNLHKLQDRSGGAGDGHWAGYGSFTASSTGSVLQAFEINTHLESSDPQEDPYAETVARGMRYLMTQIRSKDIVTQPYGDPDTNGNGIGLEASSTQPIYEGGMMMMAIAASGTPLAVAANGGENVRGRIYHDILTDMADMYFYGQTDDDWGGGWQYNWNYNSDNSACQWAVLGLEAAEEAFNIVVPRWVKDRNLVWLKTSSNGIGFGYTNAGNGDGTTPSGLAQLAFDGVPRTDYRWVTAENYLASVWDSWYVDTINYYALFALAKAARIALPDEMTIMGEGTPWAIDWYRDNERGVARTVLNDQKPDGSFAEAGNRNSWIHEGPFRTAWGVVILSKTLFVKPPVADAGPDRVYGVDWELTLDGSISYHTDPFRNIVLYEWDVNGDGVYDYSGTSPAITHIYHDLGTFTATLRVTDDNVPPKYDTDSAVITIAVPPHPPIALPGGPYTATAGVAASLNGSGSYDIDPTDHIVTYGWELDGAYPYDFDDAFGPTPQFVWDTPGTYNVGLRVWDNGVMNDLDDDGQVDENERLTDTQWTTVTVVTNLPPQANAGGPYTVDEGTPVVLDGSGSSDPNGNPLTYAWDLDQDGDYDDAAVAAPGYTFMDNGTYVIGLQVSDGALADSDTATVTVADLAPSAAFTWTPEPQAEGVEMAFSDASTSAPDAIVSWAWDFGGLGSSSDRNPSFTFMDDGTYAVTLTVTDDDGSTDTITHQVTVTDRGPTAMLAGDTLLDQNQSGSYDASGSASAPDGIVLYEWDWNYGGSTFVPSGDTGSTHSHAWDDAGTHTVAMRVTDDDGSADLAVLTVTVNAVIGPTAALTGDNLLNEGQTGNFDAGGSVPGSSPIVAYEWDWHYDGSTFAPSADTGTANSHVWPDDGVYPVAVRVTDSNGRTDIATANITVGNLPPAVEAGPDQTIEEGAGISFNGSFTDPGSLDTHTIVWDFGDGTTASGSLTPNHTYPDSGSYTVTLTVTDDDGGIGSDTLSLTVEAGQVSPEQTIFNLAARAKDGKVQLTWSPVTGAGCYNIYRATISGGPYIQIAACLVTDYSTYLDEGVVNNTTYYYVVRSVAGGIESLNSNEAGATPISRTR